jgi:hypothetical protein
VGWIEEGMRQRELLAESEARFAVGIIPTGGRADI